VPENARKKCLRILLGKIHVSTQFQGVLPYLTQSEAAESALRNRSMQHVSFVSVVDPPLALWQSFGGEKKMLGDGKFKHRTLLCRSHYRV